MGTVAGGGAAAGAVDTVDAGDVEVEVAPGATVVCGCDTVGKLPKCEKLTKNTKKW